MGYLPHIPLARSEIHSYQLVRTLVRGEPDSEVATMNRFLISLGCIAISDAAAIEDPLLGRTQGMFGGIPDTPRPELGTATPGGH